MAMATCGVVVVVMMYDGDCGDECSGDGNEHTHTHCTLTVYTLLTGNTKHRQRPTYT